MESTEAGEIACGMIAEAVEKMDCAMTDEKAPEVFIKTEMLSEDFPKPEADLKRSESFALNLPEILPQPLNDSKLDSQPSRVQSKTPSRPESSHKASRTSLAPSSKLHKMNLPHALGAKPKYLLERNASKGLKKNEDDDVVTELAPKTSFMRATSFVMETKTSKLRMDSQSSVTSSHPVTKSSLVSTAMTKFQANKLPSMYRKKTIKEDDSPTRSISSAPTDDTGKGEPEFMSDQAELMKNQVRMHSMKALEAQKKATELAKTIEQQRQKISDLEKQLEDKNTELNFKTERIKSLGTTMKNQREKTDKMSTVEAQLTEIKKNNAELLKEIEKKDESFQKLTKDVQKVKRELDGKNKAFESLQAEKKNFEQLMKSATKDKASGDETKQLELERMVQDLELQVQTREVDLDKLKKAAESLAGENESLKFQSLNDLKEESSEVKTLKRELSERKKTEQELKQDLLTLKSKLEDELHKMYRNENLLQLRGEFIKTLQDTEEVNKARLVLQAKDIENLAAKLSKAKKFKVASQEELGCLHNTLKDQQFKIDSLERDVEIKEAKIMKMKGKLKQ